jgi:hypothetical protein
MLTETFHSIVAAARKVLTNWRAMLLLAIVYASLLAALYFFVAIREASIGQVVLTFALAILVPVLFFVLQSMVAGQTNEATAGSLLRRSLTSFWKLILITLPLIALAVLIAYLLGKAQNRFGVSVNDVAATSSQRLAETANRRPAARPIDWKVALFSTIRYLCFGLVLPLAAIHLWLATVRDGLGGAIRRIATLLARAFAPQSVLIYIAGFLIFAVAPYFLLFRATQTKHAWLELSLLVGRLVVVFALTLFGWTITVRALAQPSPNRPQENANKAT